ncbi:MAG: hypothetical protein HY807_08215 [Nitrospirae bacterium]|nr:hypothetical protein [Nitrospirota bacterium]
MKKLLEGQALEKRAQELGCSTQGAPITQSISGYRKATDDELQRRVIEAERSIRESRLWLLALLSAIVSIISAITAIIAVTKN